jgi:hypothetical protein
MTSDGAYAPVILNASTREGRREAERLAGSPSVRVHDTFLDQLADLVRTENPSRKLDDDEVAAGVRARLEGRDPAACGVWVHYPWSGRLVHLLPPDDFRRLRADRNRYKITPAEQERLRRARIGVVGLSVGQATVVTMALEGVGGAFRLADMDGVELSNMNRLRADLADLGVNKAVLAARQIAEIDPWIRVEVLPEGVTDDNMDRFLAGGGKLDLLVEECDDLYVKVRVRERARDLGVPVLMDTSDRGLIDIERFDREPDRPLFHGLAGDLEAERLRGLSASDKIPYVLRIMGEDKLSDRGAASLMEVEQTIRTWPQLASGVTLGAAVSTDAARRLLLDELTGSGRFYVDLEAIVADGASEPLPQAEPFDVRASPEALAPASAPAVPRGGSALDLDAVAALVAHGVLAPSGGNCQPWRFAWDGGALRCVHDTQRSRSYLDLDGAATHLAFGAVVENIAAAAAAAGRGADVHLFPDDEDPALVCEVRFPAGGGASDLARLAAHVPRRVTNRRLAPRVPLEPEEADELRREAAACGARLELVARDEELREMGDVLGAGDRLRFLNRTMHAEMMAELRWNREEVERTRDGLDVATLELSPSDLAAMKVVSSWRAMRTVGVLGGGTALEKPARRSVESASALGLVSVEGTGRASWFAGGRAMQRVWLAATALGLSLQPMTAITYLFPRLRTGRTEHMSGREVELLASLRRRFAGVFDVSDDRAEPMLVRLARAGPPSARSLRRPVSEVLDLDARP